MVAPGTHWNFACDWSMRRMNAKKKWKAFANEKKKICEKCNFDGEKWKSHLDDAKKKTLKIRKFSNSAISVYLWWLCLNMVVSYSVMLCVFKLRPSLCHMKRKWKQKPCKMALANKNKIFIFISLGFDRSRRRLGKEEIKKRKTCSIKQHFFFRGITMWMT